MLIDQFLEYLSLEKKYSIHTIDAYRNDLQAFRLFCAKEFPTQDIDTIDYQLIRPWIVSLVTNGIGNRSVNRKVSSLKSYYKFLVRIEQIEVSPLLAHKALKVSQRVQVPFSQDELAQVIDVLAIADDFVSMRNKLVVELLYSTGMRRSELIELNLDAVDLNNQLVKVLGKRNKERIIPLISTVQESIKKYMNYRSEIESNASQLLITKKGNKLYPTLVYRIINEYFSKVSTKVKKSPHIIRHSFATHLLNEGADLNSVKELLGHSSLASTQVYTHSNLKELKKVYNQAHPRSDKN